MSLGGKVVAVTGAFGAVGAAVVEAIQAAGGSVAAIDAAPAERAPARSGAALNLGGIDLRSAESARAALAAVAEQCGRIDGLVNVAGGFRYEPVAGGSVQTWDFLFDINLRTALTATQEVLPFLGAGGRIVNIGAIAAQKAGAGMGPYAASKAAVLKLTEALSEELKDRGITVNAVLPSIVDTPQNRNDMPRAEFGRWVRPEQVAALVVFLLSPRACAITGALIPVAGRV